VTTIRRSFEGVEEGSEDARFQSNYAEVTHGGPKQYSFEWPRSGADAEIMEISEDSDDVQKGFTAILTLPKRRWNDSVHNHPCLS